MADRSRGVDSTLFADFPATLVRLFDPTGAALTTLTPTLLTGSRYSVVVPAPLHVMSGVYTAVWEGPTGTYRQTYTVGEQPLAGMTKWDTRIAIARRLGAVQIGRVTFASQTSIVDSTIIGGSNEYAFWYVMMPPGHPDAGRVFRVTGSNGSALELSHPLSEVPVEGTRFALFLIDPVEIDDAMNLAVSDVSEVQRIPTMITAVPMVNGMVTIPAGMTYISQVFESSGSALTPNSWAMQAGRRILVAGDATGSVSLLGVRDAGLPVWEDSILETPSAVTVSRGAMILHASRAGGQAVDVEENLRRQLAAQDEFDRALRRSAGRVPRGMVEVLP